jgi:hypothetical protein
VDGREVSLPDKMAYKGMMLSDVPNFAFAIGYTNASWTLKVDLVCDYLCRVLAHLAAHGQDYCVPEVGDAQLEHRPLLDFAAGYVQRSIDAFPRQGSVAPWQLNMSYAADVESFRTGAVDDGTMRFGTRAAAPARAA